MKALHSKEVEPLDDKHTVVVTLNVSIAAETGNIMERKIQSSAKGRQTGTTVLKCSV